MVTLNTLIKYISNLAPRLPWCIWPPAAAFSMSFCVWAARLDGSVMNQFILTNKLPSGLRSEFVIILLVGLAIMLLTGMLFIVVSKLVFKINLKHSVEQFARLVSPFTLAGFFPILAAPGFEVTDNLLIAIIIALFLVLLWTVTGILFPVFSCEPVVSLKKRLFGDRVVFALVAIAATSYAIYFLHYTISAHNSFHTYAFDLGW